MSERPFMQLYVSDFIGDTLHLSTEQVGAYLLLLMAMWNAGGTLPDDDAKLARIVRMSIKKWRATAAEILTFFDRSEGLITHHRLTKELQKSEGKSQSRASAGARGGAAKALKDKERRLANASVLPQHLPDTITRTPSSLRSDGEARERKASPSVVLQSEVDAMTAQSFARHCEDRRKPLSEPQAEMVVAVLREVRALGGNPSDALKLAIRKGWVTLEIEYLRNAGFPFKVAPPPPVEPWAERLAAFRQDGTWIHAWGPKPGEPGCRVPADLLARAA